MNGATRPSSDSRTAEEQSAPAAAVQGDRKHILVLDGFRALAIYLVVNLHFGIYIRRLQPYNVVTAAGWMGVPLFFVLSGMLLSLPYVTSGLKGGPCPTVGRFYRRRVLRIFPLFYLSLVVFVSLQHLRHQPSSSVGELMRHLFFLHNYQRDFSTLNPPYWSLAVEVQFYVVMPFIGIGLYRLISASRVRETMIAIAGLAAAALAYRVVVAADHQLMARYGYKCLVYMSTVSNFDSFATGILCAFVYGRFVSSGKPIFPASTATVLLIASCAGLYWLMWFDGVSGYRDGAFSWFAPALFYSCLNACWGTSILATLSLPSSFWARILQLRVAVFISAISYSIYIWHPLCSDVARVLWRALAPNASHSVKNVAILLTEAILLLVVSTISYAAVERPFLHLKPRKVRSPSG